MSDEVTFDKPAKKKPAKKAAKSKAAPPAPKAAEPFPGLTKTDCAAACGIKGCVISGGPFCGHPTKGAQINQSDPASIKRLQAAREQLRIRLDPNRFTGE